MTMTRPNRNQGFSLIELTVGLVLVGVILLAFAGVMNVMQKSSASTSQHAEAQQNARTAIDFITDNLRAAGSDIEAYNGQAVILHADPYQIVFNGDFDHGETIQGEAPLGAINAGQSPNTYPPGGATTLYKPDKTYSSGAETIVFTLDSDQDGAVTAADQGDDAEEDIPNDHLYVLKRYVQGYESGASNQVRESNVSLVRGPVAYPNGDVPPPLFEYYYNDDDDKTTPDKLWGDDITADGKLDEAEIASLTEVPDSLLHAVRRVKVNVVAESMKHDSRYQDNEGFAEVRMSSQVYIRNVDIHEASLVYGTVWYDANGNGTRDSGESGMPKVPILLQGSGRKTITDGFGQYTIPVNAGSFVVVETDPTGYSSSTANNVTISLQPGEKKEVNFGDTSSYQFGYISGTVYNDANQDMYQDYGETGLEGVTVQLSNDMRTNTNAEGYYRFTIPLGTYSVEEIDLIGYGSTTPNSVTASVTAQGDSAVVNFGDMEGPAVGTLRGWVYLDDDEDGSRDFGESGIPDVSIQLSNGDKTVTDASGYYEFTLDPAKYDVYELDPDNHTSSTPNLVEDVLVEVDSTVTVNFGDMPIKDLDFIEVFVGDTERPLSVSATDMAEDTYGDVDIVLGTPTSVGPGNLFLFINKYQSASTPISDLFDTQPTYVRSAGSDVNTIQTYDFDRDLREDVMIGTEDQTGNNMQVWLHDAKNLVKFAPDVIWTSGSNASVSCTRLADLNRDGNVDVIAGQRGNFGPNTGGFEIFYGYGNGYFYNGVETTTFADGQALGAVSDIDVADLDRDGDLDLVVGSNDGPYWGHIDLYYNASGTFVWKQRYLAKAEVNQVDAVELWDAYGGTDILAAVSEAPSAGGMHVWLNHSGRFGTADTTSFSFDAYTQPRQPDEYVDAGGEGLVVRTTNLDGDIYPDILLGTRSSSFFTGDLFLIRRTSTDVSVKNVKINIAGEVVALDFADFNKDGQRDIVTTTRTSNTSGKLAVYFLDTGFLAP